MELQKTYKELVESYFELTDYLTGENDPKLTKQLQKAGVEFTVEEVQAFQELLLAVFDNEKEVIFTFNFSNILPDYEEQENWAFDGSCNSQGNVGEFTSEILDTLEESRYCYIYDDIDEPIARFYYLEKNGVYALADLYSNRGHGFYLAPQILLCCAFGLKLGQFERFDGKLVKRDNVQGFWSNLASAQYKHFVNGDFDVLTFDEDKVNEVYCKNGCAYSNILERYITESELEDGDYVYCSNVDDYDDRYNAFYCENCDEWFSPSGHYIETEDCSKFCSIECACNCGYTMTEDGELVYVDDTFICEDCCGTYLDTEGYEGADGYLYCENCICNHEEEDEEE